MKTIGRCVIAAILLAATIGLITAIIIAVMRLAETVPALFAN